MGRADALDLSVEFTVDKKPDSAATPAEPEEPRQPGQSSQSATAEPEIDNLYSQAAKKLRADPVGAVLPKTPFQEALEHYHRSIPPRCLHRWHKYVREFCKVITTADTITFGTACTGTDLFFGVLERMIDFWRSEFKVFAGHSVALFHCEKDDRKQAWLSDQFDVNLMIPNVSDIKMKKVYDTKDASYNVLPHASICGGVFFMHRHQ